MQKTLLGASTAALMMAAATLTPAIGQSTTTTGATGMPSSITTLTCVDIVGLPPAHAAALV